MIASPLPPTPIACGMPFCPVAGVDRVEDEVLDGALAVALAAEPEDRRCNRLAPVYLRVALPEPYEPMTTLLR